MSPGDGHDRKRTEGISRRNVFRAGAGTGAVLAMGGLTAAPAGASPGHDRHGGPGERLRLVNGKIHTMDWGDRVVSSVVIEDGRFAAVGRGGDHGGGHTRTIDLRGRTVIPGLRRRFAVDRWHRRVGRAAVAPRRVVPGATAGRRGRLAQRERRRRPRGTDPGRRGVGGGRPRVRHHRGPLHRPPCPGRHRGPPGPAARVGRRCGHARVLFIVGPGKHRRKVRRAGVGRLASPGDARAQFLYGLSLESVFVALGSSSR